MLIQNRQQVIRARVDDVQQLEKLLTLFFGWQRPEIAAFDKAVEQFKTDLPAVLKADTAAGKIVLDSETTLSGIPAEVWDYKLGNRSALEWILDQYKEKKPKDPTIREKFSTYRFADHKDKVIDLLVRVTTVSVRTVAITRAMAAVPRQD